MRLKLTTRADPSRAKAAERLERTVDETLASYPFTEEHWRRIRSLELFGLLRRPCESH